MSKHCNEAVEGDDGGLVICRGCKARGTFTEHPAGECPTPYKPDRIQLAESMAREQTLQQRLNAADQRIDELEGQLSRLSAIGELIRSQDNRCTDQPMFAVMEKRSMVTLDTHDHDRIDWVETESGDYGVADDVRASRL